LLEKLAGLVNDKKIDGISDLEMRVIEMG